MARAWIIDRWLKDSARLQADGSTIRVSPPANVKRALPNVKDPFKSNVPDEFRAKDYGRGKRWQVKWFEFKQNGGYRTRSASFSKKEEAEQQVIAVSDDQLSGRYINLDDARMSFADAASEWMLSKHDIASSTRKQYEDYLRSYVLPRWGSTPLSKINEGAINAWISDLKSKKAPYEFKEHAHKEAMSPSPRYMRLIVSSTFGGVIRYSFQRGWIATNPMANIHLSKKDPSKEDRLKVFLTHEEVEELAKAAESLPSLGKYNTERKDHVSATAIRFMAYVGTRAGETFALRVGDIDLEHRRASITKTITRDFNEGPTKGRKNRKVALPSFLIDELQSLMKGHNVDDYLFRTSRGGTRINPDNWRWRVFYQAAESAGLGDVEGLRPHSLRHTFASLSIKAGCDVVTLAAALGHADVKETLNEYAGLWPDRLEEVSDALESDRKTALNGD